MSNRQLEGRAGAQWSHTPGKYSVFPRLQHEQHRTRQDGARSPRAMVGKATGTRQALNK